MVKKVNVIKTVDTSDLFKKAEYDAKIKDIELKISDITINDFNKFSCTVFDETLKQAKLATNKDLDTVGQCAVKKMRKNRNSFKNLILIILLLKLILKMMEHKTIYYFN